MQCLCHMRKSGVGYRRADRVRSTMSTFTHLSPACHARRVALPWTLSTRGRGAARPRRRATVRADRALGRWRCADRLGARSGSPGPTRTRSHCSMSSPRWPMMSVPGRARLAADGSAGSAYELGRRIEPVERRSAAGSLGTVRASPSTTTSCGSTPTGDGGSRRCGARSAIAALRARLRRAAGSGCRPVGSHDGSGPSRGGPRHRPPVTPSRSKRAAGGSTPATCSRPTSACGSSRAWTARRSTCSPPRRRRCVPTAPRSSADRAGRSPACRRSCSSSDMAVGSAARRSRARDPGRRTLSKRQLSGPSWSARPRTAPRT